MATQNITTEDAIGSVAPEGERVLTFWEVADSTDKAHRNLTMLRSHLYAIQNLLGSGDRPEEENALNLAFAGDHFIKLIEQELVSLTEQARSRGANS